MDKLVLLVKQASKVTPESKVTLVLVSKVRQALSDLLVLLVVQLVQLVSKA
jgi:hypothetical protein